VFTQEVDVFDVFRFAWFCVRTFIGLIALVLAMHGALWLFVKTDSARIGNSDPGAALRRVNLYNAQAGMQERKERPALPAAMNDCKAAATGACDHY
jgi:hypothetical protein